MPGYCLANVDKNNLDKKYFCNLCSLLLRDAIQTGCGHFYCNSCIEQRFGNPASPFRCTVDGNVLHKNQTFGDRFMSREILGLMVSCTFQGEGCTWTGEVQHLEDHVAKCNFMKVLCVHNACGLLVKKVDLYDHLRRECICRQEKCRICDKEVIHLEMKEHMRSDHNHLHYEMDNLRDVVDDVLHEQDNLRDEQRDLRDEQRDLRHRLQQLEEHLTLRRNESLADSAEYVGQQEFPSYDGQLLWKIDDYVRKRNDAVSGQQLSFYSPCFYTSRNGYKVRARLFLNGDGVGLGTHISVFFVVMRGQYDELLRWPFRRKVTFMLLDQDNVEHVIAAFRPDPSRSSFQRPRRESNIVGGCPLFCPLAELDKHAYVRNNTAFLKIIVDDSDL